MALVDTATPLRLERLQSHFSEEPKDFTRQVEAFESTVQDSLVSGERQIKELQIAVDELITLVALLHP